MAPGTSGRNARSSTASPVDDVGFFRTMLDDLVNRNIADEKRIYATVFSFGALMSYTLACSLPDRIAAIAPVASAMNESPSKIASLVIPSLS